jgi:glycine/D-amino acid oxidase-like deaminating enzyme
MAAEVVIVGGGVSGVTTGIVLQLLGYQTRLLCQHWIGDTLNATRPDSCEPRFASQYAAASVIPHSAAITDESWHLHASLRLFEVLRSRGDAGVRTQRHYEIFEWPQLVASYAEAMPGYHVLPVNGKGEPGVPRRADGVPVYGWSFQAYFADMPRYCEFLSGLYCRLGGKLEKTGFCDVDTLMAIRASVIVNCGGAWGRTLWGDACSSRYVRGILVRAHAGDIPRNQTTGEICSYNYHPAVSVYCRSRGRPADVYFYPRSDGWILGGTRLESTELSGSEASDVRPVWQGETWRGPVVRLPLEGSEDRVELAVPEPILTLNRELIRRLTGVDVNDIRLTAAEGFRHQRQTVRLESETQHGRSVMHNYGHGGAGITLSWSCAIKVAELVCDHVGACADLRHIETQVRTGLA